MPPNRMLAMNTPHTRAADRSKPLTAEMLAARLKQLGTALTQLATELARERRRNAQLERELTQWRRREPAHAA